MGRESRARHALALEATSCGSESRGHERQNQHSSKLLLYVARQLGTTRALCGPHRLCRRAELRDRQAPALSIVRDLQFQLDSRFAFHQSPGPDTR